MGPERHQPEDRTAASLPFCRQGLRKWDCIVPQAREVGCVCIMALSAGDDGTRGLTSCRTGPRAWPLGRAPARQSSGPPTCRPLPGPGPPPCKRGGYVPPQKQAERGTHPGDTWWPRAVPFRSRQVPDGHRPGLSSAGEPLPSPGSSPRGRAGPGWPGQRPLGWAASQCSRERPGGWFPFGNGPPLAAKRTCSQPDSGTAARHSEGPGPGCTCPPQATCRQGRPGGHGEQRGAVLGPAPHDAHT